jgi:hypothetical protein
LIEFIRIGGATAVKKKKDRVEDADPCGGDQFSRKTSWIPGWTKKRLAQTQVYREMTT